MVVKTLLLKRSVMKIKTGHGSISLSKLIAIYSISMVTSLPGLAISPILGKLETIFHSASELQLQMLESLPSFIIIPFILLAGKLSLKVNRRKLLIAGLAIFFGCSVTYPFINNLNFLLFISGLLGVGAGMVIPFSTGLVADYFTGNYRTKQLGIVSAITNFTLVLATLLAGFLAGISWHLSFVVYCISGISLYYAFSLDDKPPYTAEESQSKPVQAPSHPHWPVKLMLLYYLITLLALTVPLNLSLYMHNLQLGNYDTSGTLISVFFLSMTLPGLFINKILEHLKQYTNFISMVLISVGLILFTLKAGLFLLTIGVIAIGLGYGTMQPVIYDRTVSNINPKQAIFALSLVMVMNYVAIVTYPFLLKLLENLFHSDSAYFPFFLCMILSVAFTIFVFFRRHTETLG